MSTTMLALTMAVVAAAPKVDQVVLYPDRAQVTRAGEVTCTAGATRVTFEGIPPAADPSTFRAAAKGGVIEGLRSETRTLEQAFSADLAKLDEELRKNTAALAVVEDDAARLQNRSTLGSQFESVAVQLISRDMAVSRPDPKVWSTAFDASLGAQLDAVAQRTALRQKRRELQWQREDLQRKQQLLAQGAQRSEHVAEVLVKCAAGSTARVELTYLVGGAGWQPAYEARSDEPSAVELGVFATVSQSTGESWSDAKILLSTAVPSQDATPPELQAMKVYAEERSDKKVLVRREERIQHAEASGPTGPGGTGFAARAQGLSVQLEVPKRGDVPGDGSPVRLMVGRYKLPAKFAWRTYPALAPFVFRVADLTNTAPFPLLEGPVDGFGRSGFIGRTPLERIPQGGAFHLTFGLEDGARVERTVLSEVQREAGLFNQKKRFNYAYRFEVGNYTGKPLELELADRVPVSELDDVTVEIDSKQTTAGYQQQKQDGVLTWKLKLQPGEKKRVELWFHVDVPDSYAM